ncbi:GT-D fold domain-containing glycosyltransferase [Roseburia sp. 499]|uniref:GT-D fold domain-containing glycosyltransferase n=1 Tax=Roseburia sp. 499 TaxID=1261634 RepID=UPI0009F83E1E|nr:GT-D fold domain-containing glycosyltransferase [Roseburia sp. 499]WVK70034.1 GT-D fold domain-containing glycosyltransferase [Roseburia sp. 499]
MCDERKLEEEISILKNTLREISQSSQEMFQVICQMNESLGNAHLYIMQMNTIIDNVKYEILDPRVDGQTLFFPHIESCEKTIDKIVEERKSMARFGDGEFSLMSKVCRQKFQRLDNKLAERLEEVIRTDDDRILIGIADNYGNLDKYNKTSADSIRIYMTKEVREMHQQYLSSEKIYYNAYMSRPYVIMKENGKEETAKRFANLKRIWEDRDVIIVEGALTRMGMGNDLLENAKSIRRILAPATSSFDKYDDILKASLEIAEEGVLFLIAMGPSAGVLAYDLTKHGYQAIDIGHVDLEYEWFLAGKGERVSVKNKYNNEMPRGDVVEGVTDEKYNSEIVVNLS